MATNFPGDKDNASTTGGNNLPSAGTELSDTESGHPSHAVMHENVGDAIIATQTKVGIGSSAPAANTVLTGTGSGESSWSTISTGMIADGQVTEAKLAAGIPGVNTAGTQDTSGNAATADKWASPTTLTVSGDMTGSVVFDGSDTTESLVLTAALEADDIPDIPASKVTGLSASHNHNDLYYTETESDARFLGKTAKAADSEKLDNINSTQFFRSDEDDTTTGRVTISNTNTSTAGSQALNIVAGTNSAPDAGISFQYGTGGTVVNHGVFRMSNSNLHRYVFLQENNASLADIQCSVVYYNGGSFGTSDLTLKNKVGDAPGLDFVDSLSPFTGTWKADEAQQKQFFLGAQEVEAALESAGFDPDDYGMTQFNTETDALSMDYGQLVPVLIQAVKDLKARLEALESN